jgi:two-component sensor histidine kinase
LLSKTTNDDSLRITLYQQISKQQAKKQFDTAYYYAKKSLALSQKIGNDNLIIESYKSISYAFDYQYKIDSTLFWYQKALDLALKTDNKQQLSKLYNHIGIAHYYKGTYDESIKNLYKALDYSEQLNDSLTIARSCNNIGYILDKQGNHAKALPYLKRALSIKEKIDSKQSLISSLFNISSISFRNNDFDEGNNFLLRALHLSKEIKDTTYIAISYSYLAIANAKNKRLPQSLHYLRQSLALKDKIKDKYHYGQLLYDLGAVYANTNSFAESEKLFLESIDINKLVRPGLVVKSYRELSELYENNHQYNNSLVYYKKYTHLKDSLYNLKKEKIIKDVEAKYENGKKEQQISQLKASVTQQKLEQKFWIWVSILSILLAGTFIFFFYSYRKKSFQLARKNEIIHKTLAEKEVLFKEVHHRVKNNLQVISSILSLQIRYLKEPPAIEALKDSMHRIDSISLIHQKLYKTDNIIGIHMKEYIDDLLYNIIDSLRIDTGAIQYESNIEDIILEVDSVTPIGLILNELIINSLKHNREKDTLTLSISLIKENNCLDLQVKDNGKGISDDFDYLKTDSYGMKMIASLSKKIKAKISFTNDNGLLVRLIIHKFKEVNK